MFKELFNNIDGINLLPILSLVFFFLTFLGVIAYIFLLDKKYIKYMSELPLENNSDNTDKSGLV